MVRSPARPAGKSRANILPYVERELRVGLGPIEDRRANSTYGPTYFLEERANVKN